MIESILRKAAFFAYGMGWGLALPLLRFNRRLSEGYPQRTLLEMPPAADIWIQAASVGESFLAWEVLKRLQTAGSPEAFRRGAKYEGLKEDFGEAPLMNSYQFDAVFEDGALWKHGNLGQGIYIDPARDFVGVYFSTNGYIPPYGEDKMPGYLRRAAKFLAEN